jgi:hypothetical protein
LLCIANAACGAGNGVVFPVQQPVFLKRLMKIGFSEIQGISGNASERKSKAKRASGSHANVNHLPSFLELALLRYLRWPTAEVRCPGG